MTIYLPSFIFYLLFLITLATGNNNTVAPTVSSTSGYHIPILPTNPAYPILPSTPTIPYNINSGAITCAQGSTFTTLPLGLGSPLIGGCGGAPPGAVCTPSFTGVGQACYVTTALAFNELGASTACAALGGQLANIQSFGEFYYLAASFPNEILWINSWQGDTYGTRCIDFTTGIGGSGAITVGECEHPYNALCEFKNVSCGNAPVGCFPGVNLLINGGFELPICNQPFCYFSTIPGWVVLHSDNTVGAVDEIDTTSVLPCIEGRQCTDLASTGQVNQYFQSFPTVVGATYQLSFDFAANPLCSTTPFTVTLNADIFDSSGTSLQSSSSPFSTTGGTVTPTNLNWMLKTIPFTATTTLSTVHFSGNTPVLNCGPILDNVAVTCLPPTGIPLIPTISPVLLPYPVTQPIYPTNPIQPIVIPTHPGTQPIVAPTYPTYPTYPIHPTYPTYPINPINPINPNFPINPINPNFPINPINPILNPTQPIYNKPIIGLPTGSVGTPTVPVAHPIVNPTVPVARPIVNPTIPIVNPTVPTQPVIIPSHPRPTHPRRHHHHHRKSEEVPIVKKSEDPFDSSFFKD